MRILLLNDDALPTGHGGAAVVTDRLRRGLAARGHTVTLITTHQESDRPKKEIFADESGAIISLFTQVSSSERHFRCIRNTEVLPAVQELMNDLRPDVVHAHNLHQFLSYACLDAARAVTDKIFLTAHDVFLVAFHRVSGERFFSDTLAGRPHRLHVTDHLRAAGRKYNPLRNSRIRAALRRTGTRVISVSNALDGFLHANGIKNTRVIHHGVPEIETPPPLLVEAFQKRHHLDGPTIFFGGRISQDKGIHVLLAAMDQVLRSIPEARLLIAGSVDAVDTALRHATDPVRSAVRVTGWMAQEEMPLAYAAADIVTTPSLCLDTFNLMNAEAMAAGKPVVGTCFGGTPEIVEDNVTGFVVDPRDTKTFADQLTRLLTNADLRLKMGEAGQSRIQKEFSLEGWLKKHEEVYQR